MKKKICLCLCILMAISMMLCGCTKAEKTENTETPAADTRDILSMANRQELADRLGCSLEELDQFVVYAYHLNEILPDGETAKTDFTRGTTDDGFTWVTKDEAKTFVKSILLTTDNWSEYIIGQTITRDVTYFDENDNEYTEQETYNDVTVKSGYVYSWSNFTLILQENSTGYKVEFDGDWSGSVTEENGKYYVSVPDDDGWYKDVEFSAENFTCLKADAVIFELNIPEELLVVMDDDWEYHKYSDYKDEYALGETMLPIVDDPEDPEYTLCMVGYSGVGQYVTER